MSIPPQTRLGLVHLTVSDLEKSLLFYQERLGFRIHEQQDQVAWLGAGNGPLLQLTEKANGRLVPNTTGLYHFAIRVPDRRELAQSLGHIARTQTPLDGLADHIVSEAIYLGDVDEHGIEIYRDRPRETWQYAEDGLKMETHPLNLDSLLAELRVAYLWEGLHQETAIGHIHLRVNNIRDSEHFYCDLLGFDLITRYGPHASFVSAGGYHHHIGFNTWTGADAVQPPADALKMEWFQILLPHQAALTGIQQRTRAAGLTGEDHPEGWLIQDPSGNRMMLKVAPAKVEPSLPLAE